MRTMLIGDLRLLQFQYKTSFPGKRYLACGSSHDTVDCKQG